MRSGRDSEGREGPQKLEGAKWKGRVKSQGEFPRRTQENSRPDFTGMVIREEKGTFIKM